MPRCEQDSLVYQEGCLTCQLWVFKMRIDNKLININIVCESTNYK